jgi:hypothetical protein
MTKVKDMTINDLEELIEQKLLEILGDPDSGLRLEKGFNINWDFGDFGVRP